MIWEKSSVVRNELYNKRSGGEPDIYVIPTKFYVGLVVIVIIIDVCTCMNNPMYLCPSFFVMLIAASTVSLIMGLGYPILMKMKYKGEIRRFERMEKREKQIESKLRNLENLKGKLELEIINNKANADLEKSDYDKGKYEDIFKFFRSCIDDTLAHGWSNTNSKFMDEQRFGYVVLNTKIIYIKCMPANIDWNGDIDRYGGY